MTQPSWDSVEKVNTAYNNVVVIGLKVPPKAASVLHSKAPSTHVYDVHALIQVYIHVYTCTNM